MTARHGTHNGYAKHIRDDTEVCQPCRRAERIYQAEHRASRTSEYAQVQARYQWSRRKALQDLMTRYPEDYDTLREHYAAQWDAQHPGSAASDQKQQTR